MILGGKCERRVKKKGRTISGPAFDFVEVSYYPITLRNQWQWCCNEKDRHLGSGDGVIGAKSSGAAASCNAIVRQSFDESAERMAAGYIRKFAHARI